MNHDKETQIEFDVTVKVRTVNARYGGELYEKTLAQSERKVIFIGTTDAPRRKLIMQAEDVLDEVTREVTGALHNTPFLTDGEVAKATEKKEDSF